MTAHTSPYCSTYTMSIGVRPYKPSTSWLKTALAQGFGHFNHRLQVLLAVLAGLAVLEGLMWLAVLHVLVALAPHRNATRPHTPHARQRRIVRIARFFFCWNSEIAVIFENVNKKCRRELSKRQEYFWDSFPKKILKLIDKDSIFYGYYSEFVNKWQNFRRIPSFWERRKATL